MLLSAILLSIVSYCPSTAIAECQCEDEGCYRLTVQVLGYEGYVVHDELVMIRYFEENESAPVLYENRTVVDGIAYFCIEGGEYWVDVRNVWVNLTIDGDIDFVFPYLLFDDVENPDNENSIPETPSEPDVVLWLGIAVAIIAVVVLSLLAIEKRKKK